MSRRAVLSLLAIASASSFGCFDAPTASRSLTVERIAMPSRFYTPLSEPLRTVVRSTESWQTIWARAFPDPASRPPLPFVNFEDEMIVVVALGEQSSGGNEIEVAEAFSEGSGARIALVHWRPGSHCAVTAALTQPIDVVRVPRRIGVVRFEERRKVRDCGN